MKVGKWEYPNDRLDTVKINKVVSKEITLFCKRHKITKSALVEKIYCEILIQERIGIKNKLNIDIDISKL